MNSDWIVTDLEWLANLLSCLKHSKLNKKGQFELNNLFGPDVPVWDLSKPLEHSIDSTKVELNFF